MSAWKTEKMQKSPENSTLCRLCSSKQNLIDIFAEESEKSHFYQKLFLCATGIQIKKDDIVSKMVCQSCCEIAIKLHKYRTNAIANDISLKEKYSSESNEIRPRVNLLSSIHAIHLFNFTLKKELCAQLEPFPYGTVKVVETANSTTIETHEPPKINHHPSVKKLLNSNPRLIIPNNVFTQDLSPVVSLDEAEVTMWYEEQVNKIKKKLGNITIKKIVTSDDLDNSIKSNCIDKTPAKNIVLELPANELQGNNADNVLDLAVNDTSSLKKSVTTSNHLPTSNLSEIVNVQNVRCPKVDKQKQSTSATNSDDCYESLLKNLLLQITSSIKFKEANQKVQLKNQTSGSIKDSEDEKVNGLPLSKVNSKNSSVKTITKKRTSSEEFLITSKRGDDVSSTSNKRICLRDNSVDITATAKTPQNGKLSGENEETIFNTTEQFDMSDNSTDAFDYIDDEVDEVAVPSNEILNGENQENESLKSNVPDAPEYDPLFNINSSKSLEVFICPTCMLVCETKKMLAQHQKSHLTCTSCKKRFKTASCLESHVKNSCIMSRVHDNAVVKLIPVDTIPSIIEKYSTAFNDQSKEGDHFNNEGIQYYNFQIRCENDIKIELETAEHNIAARNKFKSETNVVCISDDSDNDVEFTSVTVKKGKDSFVQKTAYLDLTESELDITNNSFYFIAKLHTNQNDLLQNVYKKYVLNKVQNTTQTFKPCSRNIKCTFNNIIVLPHMYTELLAYKIPIQLEHRPKIGARFGDSEATGKKIYPLEYWGHKKSIDICSIPPIEPETNNVLSSKPDNINSSDLQDSTLPFKIIDVSTDVECHDSVSTPTTTLSSNSTATKTLVGSPNPVNAPCLEEMLTHTKAVSSKITTVTPNVPLPVDDINLKSLLNMSLPVANPQLITLDRQPDLGAFSTNGIILNTLPSTSHQNLLIHNNITPLSNIIVFSNQTQQTVVNNILHNTNLTNSVNMPTVTDNVSQPQNCTQFEIIDVD
ncbi:hypothetical protein RN001_001118 [Aquatica leii]|uniref:ZAD domain-containing protein n=1 Tax=Aquatica leii TaxID=1421715 RepID=A0AAN7PFQ8_9COLE|nr:hypothetical protein RN001_001118 [Aquatica leii]